MNRRFILNAQEAEWLYMLLEGADKDTPHGRFFHDLADSIMPTGQLEEEARMRNRLSELVDKKFLAGLSQAEDIELSELNRRLDEIDGTNGAATLRLLGSLEQTVLYKEAAGAAILALLALQEQVTPADDGRFPSFSPERVEQLHDYLRLILADSDIRAFLARMTSEKSTSWHDTQFKGRVANLFMRANLRTVESLIEAIKERGLYRTKTFSFGDGSRIRDLGTQSWEIVLAYLKAEYGFDWTGGETPFYEAGFSSRIVNVLKNLDLYTVEALIRHIETYKLASKDEGQTYYFPGDVRSYYEGHVINLWQFGATSWRQILDYLQTERGFDWRAHVVTHEAGK